MAAERKQSGESALKPFSDAVRGWFEDSFEAPTPAQAEGWPAISSGENTLICAPTGSGKTLAAFLWGIDTLSREPERLGEGVKLVYVSPLKALSYDVERNLRAPLKGIGAPISVGLRTGDTPQRERQAMLRKPPDILITTPESLYLMITSQARNILTGVEAVIVDEIHAVAQTKRGAHLALTLERLSHHVAKAREEAGEEPRQVQRIGLSATQRPLERVGRFLVGPKRKVEIVDAGIAKSLDLEIRVPVEDMTEPGASSAGSDTFPGKTSASAVQGSDPSGEFPDAVATRSIWPAIYPELLELVREHNSTIIFVNNRRGAERLAKRLNELANEEPEGELPATEAAGTSGPPPGRKDDYEEIARAHHGSLAHEERLVVEEMLKSGQLPCLVATSSLELGIDMGAVDLVIQVESPKSVTRGLQRVGRAGHALGAISKGRIFPKFRADLLECAVVAKRMRAGEIEETVIPQNPLDVLAQHIVSMVADVEWDVDEMEQVVTATEPFRELGREQLENVLDMLDGRYPSERFSELRPRVAWDRTAGVVRGRKGARQLAVTNAGTIPDRGLYGVHLPDGRRVGELDEEMVYEARPGQTFLLGATTWRIEDITRDRVIVTPAPGVPGAVPFWRGDGVGRPAELGRAIGEFAREAVSATPEQLAGEYDLDRRAAENLVAYLREQQAATRVVPSDQSIVIERFRDEIGDWRLCVLSPFGGQGPRRVGAGALGEDPQRAGPGGRRDLVRRRDRHPPSRRRRGAAGRHRAAGARRGRGPGGVRAGRLGPVRRSLPRERRPLAPPAARVPGQADAAVAAAAEVAEPAGGREGFPAVPGHARDLPRVPARRARPALAGGPAARPPLAEGLAGRGRDGDRLALRLVAPLRLRRDLHVRGRYAERRAPGSGPVARP